MQLLINDLLSFSRHSISATDFKETNLTHLVKEAINELEIEIENTHATIRVDRLPVMRVIPSLMQQLFYNLINNALKFRKKTVPPEIHISAEKITAAEITARPQSVNGSSYYRITVDDNGIGFDNKYANEIFMLFKRLHSQHEFEGTGVGLSICKKIVEKHNGFLSAVSELQKGSSFIITLPVLSS